MPRVRPFPPSAFRLGRRVCLVRRLRRLGLPPPFYVLPSRACATSPKRPPKTRRIIAHFSSLWLASRRVCLARRPRQSRHLYLFFRRRLALSRLTPHARCSPPTRLRARLLTNPALAARQPARAASSSSRRLGYARRWPAFGSVYFAFQLHSRAHSAAPLCHHLSSRSSGISPLVALAAAIFCSTPS